ncbi:hypothetical protein B296_00004034 [Ensete ventricosum]|uniref:Uncharacterized protein n=1 Tax=Ensete ventricosum TaxID=4639 RepID=A0A427B6R7_ENSVE|nr:hypothetical protein B296_00004034 [Ensete ventricosum]
MLPPEVGVGTLRVENYEEGTLEKGLQSNLDQIEEQRVDAHLRALTYKNVVARLYNQRVHPRFIKMGDLVLRKAKVSNPTSSRGKLAPSRSLTWYEMEPINWLPEKESSFLGCDMYPT